jgi:hypothetical protein
MTLLMRSKDESSRCFETFLTKIRSFGHIIHTVRVDNDFVLISRSFHDVCLKWKISTERTAPYAHFHSFMLSYYGLPVHFWGYAFLAAVYIRNRI